VIMAALCRSVLRFSGAHSLFRKTSENEGPKLDNGAVATEAAFSLAVSDAPPETD
jgi:hypothetical protein